MAIAETFHVRPWEMELLTVEQFQQACQRIDQMNRESEAASRG